MARVSFPGITPNIWQAWDDATEQIVVMAFVFSELSSVDTDFSDLHALCPCFVFSTVFSLPEVQSIIRLFKWIMEIPRVFLMLSCNIRYSSWGAVYKKWYVKKCEDCLCSKMAPLSPEILLYLSINNWNSQWPQLSLFYSFKFFTILIFF